MDLDFILYSFFFFNDTAPTEIYTLSLHDALPNCQAARSGSSVSPSRTTSTLSRAVARTRPDRSEEHTSELQSQSNLVCRLLLEKKKKKKEKQYQAEISVNNHKKE